MGCLAVGIVNSFGEIFACEITPHGSAKGHYVYGGTFQGGGVHLYVMVAINWLSIGGVRSDSNPTPVSIGWISSYDTSSVTEDPKAVGLWQ